MKEFNAIIANLKKKIYHPVYFLMGEEPYFIDVISDFASNNILDDAEKEFNLSILYGRDINVSTIISEAKRYPMIGKYQVVIVKEAQNVKNIEELEPYLKNPLSTTILIICHKYKSLDKRKSFGKSLGQMAVVLDTKKLRDYQVPDWINNYLANKGGSISPKAAVLMNEFLGTDLSKIANELDKLLLNISEKTEISPAHIEKYIGISKDFNNFELQKALGNKNIFKSNQIINYFENNPKNNPLVLTISALFSYFSNILAFHYAKDKSERAVALALKINPFFVKEYVEAAKNYDIRKTVEIIGLLRMYDLKSKGVENTSANDGELLKELIFKVLH
ncbi:MAG: DNA polymerase III subunit delta [Bacteroidetes bacterium]|nr:DNA polymerase III subunit delta [Bacteroidota bacterium]HET6245252.1 DNA polymerase III subunit delta [Bacteroidia bacterium]